MTSSATDLLRVLGGRAHSAHARPDGPHAMASASEIARTGSFAQLLEAARSGHFSGGPPVTVHPSSGVSLTPDQMQRLSVAADMAQAAGATRALVRIDGMSLLMDVGVRSITASVKIAPGEVVTGIDALVEVPAAGDPPKVQAVGSPAGLRSGPLAAMPRSVADALIPSAG
ncbi:MAG: hypothetical protein KF787_09655 [Phycisphaeraceae bacterium]|nr:hypothetical protein [Phycisphaerae bacterium]MBX3392897.1 hypothetical protein [Phycisphaeraceae bacterium]